MKTKGVFVCALFALLLIAPFVYGATDYRSMSTEQLCQTYPSAMQNPSERQAFQEEWSRRMQSTSPQERQSMYQKEVTRQRTMTQTQPGTAAPAPTPMAAPGGRDYTQMSNEEFYRLCQNQQFMSGLTPEQRREIDREWQRRIPYMTPEEQRMFYPSGLRYGTAMGEGG